MKNFNVFLVALTMIIVANISLTSCQTEDDGINASTSLPDKTSQVSARSNGPSANGQGTLIADYLGNQPQHYSFHASTDQNGNVTGSFESTALGLDSRVHGTIDCLNVLPDGKTAVMSGIVTVVTGDIYLDFGFQVGYPTWFKVQDNGEGVNATEDKFSDGYIFPTLPPCTEDFDVEMLTIANGNIQVKP